jgi:predicted amidophosphoribosyltransferase
MGHRRRPYLAATARVGTLLETCARAVIDFAVPDTCCLCGRKTGELPPCGGLAPSVRCLAGGTAVPLFGPLTIKNYPFCRACLSRFEVCGDPAGIGSYGASPGVGWVRIGERGLFVHAARGAAASLPTPGAPGAATLEVHSPFWMNDASLELTRLIKFGGRRSLVRPASAAMAGALREAEKRRNIPAVLVPVPMHPAAIRRRGFNQAELLAEGVAGLVPATVVRAIRKTVRTPPQSKTEHSLRAENVRGTFEPSDAPLSGRQVYLVDDLVTTGATAASCAAAALAAEPCNART